jgi:hypothetical protein
MKTHEPCVVVVNPFGIDLFSLKPDMIPLHARMG